MPQDTASKNPQDLKPLAQGTNGLGFRLLKTLEPRDGNQTLSPISITCALAMLYPAAGGRTAQQMQETLGFVADPVETCGWFRAFLDYVQSICREEPPAAESDGPPAYFESSGDLVLTVANAVWGQKDFPFRPDYMKQVRQTFDAHIESLQFLPTPETAIDTVNQWVKKHTRGRIESILDENLPWGFVRLILTNAVYFKASWQCPFQEDATQPGPFTLVDGGTVETPFMRQQTQFGYYHSEAQDFKALEMVYGEGQLGLLVILPGRPDGLPELERWLTADKLTKLSQKLQWQGVKVTLPKFQMDCQFDLSGALETLGMRDVFDQGKADLQRISEVEPIWVTAVLHKVWIDVNEKGTEAAAVTAIMTALGEPEEEPPPPVEFCADHSFLFCVRERQSGLLLFLGRMTRP